MAGNYSYSEIQAMQEDAIRRVREMQKQSQLSSPAPSPQVAEVETKAEQTPPQNYSKSHNNNESQYKRSQKKTPPSKRGSLFGFDGILNFLGNDEFCEDALLIAILALLVSEDTDKILLLAIIYILAD